MTINSFEDLEIWQYARAFSKEIYLITKKQDFRSDVRFCSQIRSAAGSIMDNIAEGFEREGTKEFIQFLYVAKGSCGEVRSQLYRALDAGYISDENCKALIEESKTIGAKIFNMIKYLKQTEIAGNKYK